MHRSFASNLIILPFLALIQHKDALPQQYRDHFATSLQRTWTALQNGTRPPSFMSRLRAADDEHFSTQATRRSSRLPPRRTSAAALCPRSTRPLTISSGGPPNWSASSSLPARLNPLPLVAVQTIWPYKNSVRQDVVLAPEAYQVVMQQHRDLHTPPLTKPGDKVSVRAFPPDETPTFHWCDALPHTVDVSDQLCAVLAVGRSHNPFACDGEPAQSVHFLAQPLCRRRQGDVRVRPGELPHRNVAWSVARVHLRR